MRIVIVEDEKPAATKLAEMIKGYNASFQILAFLDSVEETIEWLNSHACPDVLFVDIHLSDGSGFEIFSACQVRCPIIFTTAYDQYALQAFKVNSIDYLMKPVTQKDLADSLRKYEELKRGFTSLSSTQAYAGLVNSLSVEASYKSRFLVKYGQKIKSIQEQEVAYFISQDKNTLLITGQGKEFVVDYTLDQLEELLNPALFFRLSRKVLTSLPAIKEIHAYYKGRLKIKLSPEKEGEVIVSNERAGAFKRWLDR